MQVTNKEPRTPKKYYPNVTGDDILKLRKIWLLTIQNIQVFMYTFKTQGRFPTILLLHDLMKLWKCSFVIIPSIKCIAIQKTRFILNITWSGPTAMIYLHERAIYSDCCSYLESQSGMVYNLLYLHTIHY